MFRDGRVGADAGIRDGEDVVLLHDEVLDTLQLDFLARVLSKQDRVSRFDIERHPFANLVAFAEASRQHRALLWLLLGGIGNDDGASALVGVFEGWNDEQASTRARLLG